jgi:hypothetical protein
LFSIGKRRTSQSKLAGDPGPGFYDADASPIKPSSKTFQMGGPSPQKPRDVTPGPGTYSIEREGALEP